MAPHALVGDELCQCTKGRIILCPFLNYLIRFVLSMLYFAPLSNGISEQTGLPCEVRLEAILEYYEFSKSLRAIGEV